MSSSTLTILGLCSDITGVFLLWIFGLPPDVRRAGSGFLQLEGHDENEAKKARRYDSFSHLAIVLIILGFALQLLGTLYK